MKITKEDIYTTSLEIIAFEGIEHLTLSYLSSKLGVNKSAIYNYYKSKEEIIDDIFSKGHRSLTSKAFRLSLEGEEREILKKAASSWIGLFSSEETSLFLRVVISLHLTDERAKSEYRSLSLMLYSHAEVLLSHIFERKGKELPTILPTLFSSLLMTFLNSLLEEEERDLESEIDEFIELIDAP